MHELYFAETLDDFSAAEELFRQYAGSLPIYFTFPQFKNDIQIYPRCSDNLRAGYCCVNMVMIPLIDIDQLLGLKTIPPFWDTQIKKTSFLHR